MCPLQISFMTLLTRWGIQNGIYKVLTNYMRTFREEEEEEEIREPWTDRYEYDSNGDPNE